MKTLPVEYRPEALSDIRDIFTYVYEKSRDVVTAKRFTDRIYNRCESTGSAPLGGIARSDLGKGLRMVPFEKSAVIVYLVKEDAVWIVNVFYGGRDYDALMKGAG